VDAQHDGDAIGGAVAGGFGGLVQWCRSPEGWKKLGGWVGAGAICGFLANAAVRHFLPDLSWDLRWGIAAVAGLGSADLVVFLLKLMNRLTSEADRRVDSRLGSPTTAGVVVNGQPTPAGPGATVGVLTAAVLTVAEGGAGGSVVGHGVVPVHELGGKGAAATGGE